MAPARLTTAVPGDNGSLLSPVHYDDDAASLHSRSDQDTDSDDDELQLRARNSRELRAADRIVLMEEEETDRLVTDTRKQQERQRRGSGLAVPNPLTLFRQPTLNRKSSNGSLSENEHDNDTDRRAARRTRRKQKRERLTEKAEHGEDGELMYEMEEGGMKEGSSTGESSDRSDSDEADRRQLNMVASAKADRKRAWLRYGLIYTLVFLGFAIMVLVAMKLSKGSKSMSAGFRQECRSNGTALFAPTTLFISLDGFRADFLQRGITPRLNAFVKEGVSPKYMLPSFPSVTFPNHYTLATGLYPEAHGIVGNTFWDPELEAEFYYTDPARSMDPKWWGGEPFWVTAEKQGIRSAIHMWPGSEAHIMHMEPSFVDKFNGKESLGNKVDRIFHFLDRPGKEDPSIHTWDMRPQVIAAYVPNVDQDGHKFGPNSTEIKTTIEKVDDMLDHIFSGLEARNLTDIVNVIIVSDHGMATTDVTRLMQLEDLVDTDKIEHIDGWPLYGLRPKKQEDLQELYDGLREKTKDNPNFEVYLRDVNMPARYHFSNNPRIAPLWIIPKTGWAIVTKEEFDVQQGLKDGLVYHPRGLHGYDHEHPLMRAIFIARGPAFPHPANSRVDHFQNIDVYNLLCDSVGIEPRPNNGTLRLPLKPLGLHEPEDDLEVPADPEPTTKQVSVDEPAVPSRPSVPGRPSHSVVTSQPTKSAKPEADGSQTEEGEGKDGDDSTEEEGPKSWWDWVVDKAGKAWDKIQGLVDGTSKGEKSSSD